MDALEDLEVINKTSSAPRKEALRPESVMGIIALACALLVAVLLVLSWPKMNMQEDPQAPALRNPVQQTEAVEFLEPTISETQPEYPTIPPEKNPFDRNDFQYNSHNFLLLQNPASSEK